MNDDLFQKFLEKLKAEKSPQEYEEYVETMRKVSAADVYSLMIAKLTEEDLDAIGAITDDALAKEEMYKRFKERVGKSVEEYMQEVKNALAEGYLKSNDKKTSND